MKLKKKSLILIVAAGFSMAACGSSESLSLDLTQGVGASAFADALATDLLIELTSIPGTLGKIIDADGNQKPDVYLFPEACRSAKAAGCGFLLAKKTTISVEGLPKGFEYKIAASFRDATGKELYLGTGEVNTTQSGQTVAVSVVKK